MLKTIQLAAVLQGAHPWLAAESLTSRSVPIKVEVFGSHHPFVAVSTILNIIRSVTDRIYYRRRTETHTWPGTLYWYV